MGILAIAWIMMKIYIAYRIVGLLILCTTYSEKELRKEEQEEITIYR